MFLIILYGIYPKKNSLHKKILFSLYLWMTLFFIPILFFSESGIKDTNINIRFHNILILRLIFVIVQEILFSISFMAKIKI